MARSEFHRTDEFPAVRWREACVMDRDFAFAAPSYGRSRPNGGSWPDEVREHVARGARKRAQPSVADVVKRWAKEASRVDEDEFRELADIWRRETRGAAMLLARVSHWAYQRIIGMGPEALPLILRELQREPNHWYWALNAISGEDPAEGVEGFEEARARWLDWGRAAGLLTI
jgi:hypothetical protein